MISPMTSSLRASLVTLERRRAVLEKRLLPAAKERRIETVLVARIRHGHTVKQMPPQNRNLFLGRKCPSLLRHSQNLLCYDMLTAYKALSNSD